ncbi:transmembrane protease serine 9-like [Ischnura elegans]|uniref:transmembrane protease serine 9-like n=1 Tax=Ischnura elegans TaxID=197161 RepID=UPI001ED8B0D5|nr:transmembrane protease serine 9-like [Ischnura elegans]
MPRIWILLIALLNFSQGIPYRSNSADWVDRGLDPISNSVLRIVGGDVVHGREFPAMVSIRYGESHYCGGSILNDEWIVTAASCASMAAAKYQVVVGSNKLNEGGTTHQVTFLRAHEKYGTTPSKSYDIAVMKVSPKIEIGDGVGVVKLPADGDTPPAVGTTVTVIGWGVTADHGEFSNDLLKIEVPIANHQTCSDLYYIMTGRPVSEDQLCAGGEGGRDSCNGDAGGPLFLGDVMIGIVSWGLPCAHPRYPTVYTLVSHFTTWINTTISNSADSNHRHIAVSTVSKMIRVLLTTALILLLAFGSNGIETDHPGARPQPTFFKKALKTKIPTPYIEGGELVTGREFPWMASVRLSGYHFCDAVIIKPDTILGVASCMYYNWDLYTVKVGTNSLDTGGTVHTISEVTMHEAYNVSNSWINDIMLLKVSPQIEISDIVSAAVLPNKGQVTPVGTPGVIAGWGALKYYDLPANDLHKISVEVYDHKKCEEAYAPIPKKVIHSTQICAASKEDRKGPTNGDAGAPLMVDGVVVALASWERHANSLGYPAVFTELSHYIDWINDHMNG